MTKRYALLGLAAAAAAAAGLQPLIAHAGNNLPATCATLQAELNLANDGDTVTLSNAGVPCSVTNTPTITFPITLPNKSITFAGATPQDGLNGEGAHQLLKGTNVGSSTITNLTFENGHDTTHNAAGVDIDSTAPIDVVLTHDTFTGNTSTHGEGAVFLRDGSGSPSSTHTLTVTDSTFGGSSAGQANSTTALNASGALSVSTAGGMAVSGNHFTGNSSRGGGNAPSEAGAASLLGFASTSTIDFSYNIVTGNSQTRGGGVGGGVILDGHTINLTGNTFDGNSIPQGTTTFVGNLGGGLDILGVGTGNSVTQAHNVFENNSVGDFTNNTDQPGPFYFGGGGEYVQASSIRSFADTFVNNTVGAGGNPNTAPAGGALAVQGGFEGGSTLMASDMVVVSNGVAMGATGYGGGIYAGFQSGCTVSCPAEVDLHDSTVINNFAAEGPGVSGGEASADVGKFYNDIVYANLRQVATVRDQPAGTRHVLTSAVAQLNFASANLTVQNTDSCTGAGAAYTGGGNICSNPLLVNPNSGNVHETTSSPTINKGSNAVILAGTSTDYYGAARIQQGTVDMGAAEFAAPVTTPTPTPIPVPPTGAAVDAPTGSGVAALLGGALALTLALAGLGARRRSRRG